MPGDERALVERLLTLARVHLGAEVAWASVLLQGRQLILATSGEADAMNVRAGSDLDAESSYCIRVLSGRLPPVVEDARRHLVTRDLRSTHDLRIGSYTGVPWHSADGALTGMLCCVSRQPAPGLADRSLEYLRVVAEMLSDLLGGPAQRARHAARELEDRVRGLFAADATRIVFQPIVRLADGHVDGVEALSRFDPELFPTPDRAFAAAGRVRLGVDLELLAIRHALAHLPQVPAGMFLGLNLSAEALLDARVQETLLLAGAGRAIAIEITEHAQVSDYLELISVTERMRHAGLRIVVDDAGAGYASLHHILQLRPDVIKLDIALVRDIDRDPARQALARSLAAFAADIGASLVAEGIETDAQLAMLRELGVGYGQGYLLGRPAGPETLLRAGAPGSLVRPDAART